MILVLIHTNLVAATIRPWQSCVLNNKEYGFHLRAQPVGRMFMQPVWYTYYNISNQKTKCTKTIFLRKVSLNFSEIATEDDKDEDKASLPDTEVGEVEDFSQQ